MPQMFYLVPTTALLAERDRQLDRAAPASLVRFDRALTGEARPGRGVRRLRAAADRGQASLRRPEARPAAAVPPRPAAQALAGGLERLHGRRRGCAQRDHHAPPVALIVGLGLD